MRHAVGPAPKNRWWRYPLVGVVVAIAVTAGLVVLEGSPTVEEAVITAQPVVQPTPSPDPTPLPEPTAVPTAPASAAPKQAALAVANTEPTHAPPAPPHDYVPTFVVDSDRSDYDANVSAPLVEPTPVPRNEVVAAPTTAPEPKPTAEPKPTDPPASTNEASDKDNGGDEEADASDTSEAEEPDADDASDDDDGEDNENSGEGPTAAQWAALRNCESGGNYSIVSANGLYRGAYQFSQGTWDSTASWAKPSLVGTDPAEASPGDQDAMALALYSARGASPWPTCGRHLS